jgi:hypothetical protein
MYMPQRRNLSIGITINLDNYENLRLEVGGEVCGEGDAEDLITYLDTILSRLGRGTPETAERVDSYRRRVLASPATPVSQTGAMGVISPPGETPGQPASAPAPASTVAAPAPSIPKVVSAATAPPSAQQSGIPSTGKESVSPPAEKERATPPGSPALMKSAPSGPVALPKKEAPPAVKKDVLPTVAKKEPSAVVTKKETVPPVPAAGKEAPAPVTIPKSPSASPAESGEAQKGEAFSCERCGEPITPVQRKLSRMFQNKDLCKKCLQQL